ncbi:hypothetical protein [Kitasatospora sp. NPDC058478]|uniref:hypothetical protein n=1 Tax=unclassified Kitasatospora TaxID=2633591 RepID=UPI0036676263
MTTTHGVAVRLYDQHPALGRHQVLDARSLNWLHPHPAPAPKAVHWTVKAPVLDQQHLLQQGIRTSRIVTGTSDADALSSCTANAATAALSCIASAEYCTAAGLDLEDATAAEEWAIALYSEATRQDEWLTRQWPADDCGSSGLGVARALHARGLINSYVHATTADTLIGLLQHGPVLLGMPWYTAWFQPPSSGNLGETAGWEASGVAGGHEVCATGIEQLGLDAHGRVDPARTVLRVRNSWGASWGLDGDFLLPLTLYTALRREIDAIQLRPPLPAAPHLLDSREGEPL